ncbi:TPA: hypothetical protein N0F65_003607 [Lagenidium giganteum]|uniref:Tyrosinase copper-binding domain-containing protein n=1 Tax=Lagenidium giganteum TaxID=4803 RepID=A0AAV2Z5P0_9STRA|nr:TPA: hypothetical protein N0F65_003607 [Lagenidium giganteum]
MKPLTVVLLAMLALGAVHAFSFSVVQKAGPKGARVSKSWNMYTETEKKTYLQAVQKAMETGQQYRFVLLHNQHRNFVNAHGNCGFLLWHRRYLLAYENMLRGLGSNFASVTVPVWDYFSDTNKHLAGGVDCNSFQSCSKFLQDFGGGGSKDGGAGERQQIGETVVNAGTCVSSGVAQYACAKVNGKADGGCEGCILRGNWDGATLQLGMDFLRNFQSIPDGNHRLLSEAIEGGFHATVHQTLDGTMGFQASPFEPVFFGHHAMVDMALYLMNRCFYDPDNTINPNSAKPTKFGMFDSCKVDDPTHPSIDASSDMIMALDGTPAETAADTAAFFKSLSAQYSQYVDPDKIGDYSYTYQLDPFLKTFLQANNVKCPDYLFAPTSSKKNRRNLEEHSGNETEPAIDPETAHAIEVSVALADCGNEISEKFPKLTFTDRVDQQGILRCEVLARKSGGKLDDFNESFRTMFHMAETTKPYCVELRDRLRSGELTILASDTCKQRYGNLTGEDLSGAFIIAAAPQ